MGDWGSCRPLVRGRTQPAPPGCDLNTLQALGILQTLATIRRYTFGEGSTRATSMLRGRILRRSAPHRWRGYASAPLRNLWFRFPFSVAQMANTNGFSCFCSAFGRTTKKQRFYRPLWKKTWKSTKNAFVTLHKGTEKRRKREENGAFER